MNVPTTGDSLGQYQLVETIGSGGMATVYKAHQPKLDRYVAVKIMHQLFLSDESFKSRFEREARIIAQLDHPNIVTIYDYDDVDGLPYLVMKYVDGQTLKQLLKGGALTMDDILNLIAPIADSLTYAHEQGILHRDVKPSNIIIDERSIPYLMDFGLARIAKAGESTMSAESILGTPHYISPEQAQGGVELDARTDVYSLGVVIYELLVGQVPYTGDTPYVIVHKHIYDPPPPPTQVNPNISPAVEAVILKALEKEPKDRYPTANALVDALRAAVTQKDYTIDVDRATLGELLQNPPRAETPKPQPRAQTPIVTQDKSGGKYVTIPAPGSGDSSSASSSDVIDDLSYRVKGIVQDIRGQLQSSDIGNKIRSGLEQAAQEVKSSKSGAGISASVGSGDQQLRQTEIIDRDWGTDEASVRRRIERRTKQRNGFLIHLGVFILVNSIIFLTSGVTQIGFEEAIASTTNGIDLSSLRNFNIALIVLLGWGGGLISHAIDVFYRTGKRMDARRRSVYQAMVNRYGENWLDEVNDKEYRKVRRRVSRHFNARVGFFKHAVGSLLGFLAFFVAWNALGPIAESAMLADPEAAEFVGFVQNIPVIVALIMVFTVVLRGIGVLLSPMIGGASHERAIDRELQRERERLQTASNGGLKSKNEEKAKVAPAVRLTNDGEFTESMIQEMDEDAQQRGGKTR